MPTQKVKGFGGNTTMHQKAGQAGCITKVVGNTAQTCTKLVDGHGIQFIMFHYYIMISLVLHLSYCYSFC
jgi:hypothetical protein